jgi:hypothetical protein
MRLETEALVRPADSEERIAPMPLAGRDPVCRHAVVKNHVAWPNGLPIEQLSSLGCPQFMND